MVKPQERFHVLRRIRMGIFQGNVNIIIVDAMCVNHD
jgi:hypothetical protein